MKFERQSGILLHPTSLPGPYGLGEIGAEALAFADVLRQMGQRLWQVLALGPTGYGDSPYQSLSSFAGNQLLISFDSLVQEGLVSRRRLAELPRFPDNAVDFGRVIPARMALIEEVCGNFERRAGARLQAAYGEFCEANGADWLNDYALFAALKDAHRGAPWSQWAGELARREPAALRLAKDKWRSEIEAVKVAQFLFFQQWHRVVEYCHSVGVRIVGDIPIFVAHDSADVWAHPELFYLDDRGQPIVIAGVPPDYFSATGQRWGNPLYRWDVMEKTGFDWWKKRLHKTFELVDILKIDHFRGFEAYWEIPADEPTAVVGHWVPGPCERFFDSMKQEFGELPIIAEDLGIITPEVEALRDRYEFPGMRVLQFAFGNDQMAADYRPESYPENCVCYTGTHDNDTTVGWFESAGGEGSTRNDREVKQERQNVLSYLGTDGSEIHRDFIRLALGSKANTVIFPLQDVLGLGSEARMNTPGRLGGNWQWRFAWSMLLAETKERLRSATKDANR